ncbi:hypothetical protein EBU91_03445 [bacterium]|nr:hypothetical protein [bacterium]
MSDTLNKVITAFIGILIGLGGWTLGRTFELSTAQAIHQEKLAKNICSCFKCRIIYIQDIAPITDAVIPMEYDFSASFLMTSLKLACA